MMYSKNHIWLSIGHLDLKFERIFGVELDQILSYSLNDIEQIIDHNFSTAPIIALN